jgi:hypothetical protein
MLPRRPVSRNGLGRAHEPEFAAFRAGASAPMARGGPMRRASIVMWPATHVRPPSVERPAVHEKRSGRMCTALALGLLDGTDEATVPRYADDMLSIPPVREAMDAFRKAEEAQAARQAEWQRGAARRP